MHAVDISKGSTNTAVSNQWYSRPDDQRFTDIHDLLALKRHDWNTSQADTVDTKALEFIAPDATNLESTQQLTVTVRGNEAKPSHWSFGQTCSLLGVPAKYLRTLPSQLVADNLNYGLMKFRSEMVKAYRGDVLSDAPVLKAVTGPDYGRIPDYEVVEHVANLMQHGNWKVPGVLSGLGQGAVYNPDVAVDKNNTTLFASDRDVFLFLVDDHNPIEIGVLPNGEPDLVFRGFYVWNSEVGSKSLGLATMYLRGVCCNRILWGVEQFSEFSIRHSKYAPERFSDVMKPALKSYAEGSSQTIIEAVTAAKDAKVADDEEEALAFLRARKFSASQSRNILATVEAEEGHPARSVWDMAQGITATARSIGHQDQRIALEKEAGKILEAVKIAA